MYTVPIQKTDTLRISAWANLVGITLNVALDIRLSDGEHLRTTYILSPNSDRTETVFSVSLPDGELQSCVVYCATPYISRGQCYVRAVIHQGSVWQGQPHIVLFSDYVTSSSSLSFPGSPVRSSLEGLGYLGTLVYTLDSSYTSFDIDTPFNTVWSIVSVLCDVVISAEVGDRLVVASVLDYVDNPLYTTTHKVPLSSAGTYSVNFSTSCATEFASDTQVNIPIPTDLRLLPYYTMHIEIQDKQTGDYISFISYRYEEYLYI